MKKSEQIEKMYALARAQYAEAGIESDHVFEKMQRIAISLHYWQTDDSSGHIIVGADQSVRHMFVDAL